MALFQYFITGLETRGVYIMTKPTTGVEIGVFLDSPILIGS